METKHGELEKLTYTIFDLETTGLDPENDEIIEIGAFKIKNGEIAGIFNKLVHPSKSISQEITNLTGITNEMLEHEFYIKPVLEEFLPFVDESMLVAHNAEFDMSFMRNNIKKWLNKDISNPSLCTVLMSRELLPGLNNHKLHTVARYFKIEVANRHRAIGDVELTYQVWFKLIELLKKKGIVTRKDLDKYVILPPATGSNKENNMPDEPPF